MGRKNPNRFSRLMNLQFHNTGATISTESTKPTLPVPEHAPAPLHARVHAPTSTTTIRNEPAMLKREMEMEATSLDEDDACMLALDLEDEHEDEHEHGNHFSERSSASSLCTTSKKVRFGECAVRRYAQVLGDHPSCSMGCPLELGWDYQQLEAVSVDDYVGDNSSMNTNTNRCELRMTWEERRAILLLDPDNTDGELRRACRKLQRHRTDTCRGRKLERTFFESSV
jgi:hypothetical protein